MATRNHIGKTIYFSAALPATNNAAGYEALTWLELEHPQTLPQFGITHSNIDVEDLKSGFTKGIKGPGTGADTQGSCRIDGGALATNQATFKGICDALGGTIALKVGKGSGAAGALAIGDAVKYAQGYVHSYQENQATSTTHEGFTYSFKQNDFTVEDEQPM